MIVNSLSADTGADELLSLLCIHAASAYQNYAGTEHKGRAYDVEDIGEAPAYTIGYLVGKMYEVFRTFI